MADQFARMLAQLFPPSAAGSSARIRLCVARQFWIGNGSAEARVLGIFPHIDEVAVRAGEVRCVVFIVDLVGVVDSRLRPQLIDPLSDARQVRHNCALSANPDLTPHGDVLEADQASILEALLRFILGGSLVVPFVILFELGASVQIMLGFAFRVRSWLLTSCIAV